MDFKHQSTQAHGGIYPWVRYKWKRIVIIPSGIERNRGSKETTGREMKTKMKHIY